MLQWRRRTAGRVVLAALVLGAVLAVSSSGVVLFPTSEGSSSGGVGDYLRVESTPVDVDRSTGGSGPDLWWMGVLVGTAALIALIVAVVATARLSRRAALEPATHVGVADVEDQPARPAKARVVATREPSDAVDAAWCRVEAMVDVADRRPSRTTAWVVKEAVGHGLPAAEVRALARLHDVARYAGRRVPPEAEVEAARLADVIIRTSS